MIPRGIVKVKAVKTEKGREIQCTMMSGSVVRILPCYEGWMQDGGYDLDDQKLTIPVANMYNKWLHGID